DADTAQVKRRKKLQQATCSSADIQHGLKRLVADNLLERDLDRILGNMQPANLIPASGIGAEIGGRLFLSAGLHLRQPLHVALNQRIGAIETRQKPTRKIAADRIVRETEIGPRPFLIAIDEISFGQQLQMTRNPRL